jgi:putative membrane protein
MEDEIMRKILLASVTASLLPLAAMAQSTMPPPPVPSGQGPTSLAISNLDPTDAKFLQLASASGLAEVECGQLAASKGDPSVQKIGTQMVADHSKANAQLKALALREGITIGTAVSEKDAAMTSTLNGLNGAAFDTAYLKAQKLAHERAISLFKAEATSGSNADLKAFATNTLPILQMHLQMIEAAQK